MIVDKRLRKRLIFGIKILIVLAVAGWVGRELYGSWDSLHRIEWKPNYFWLTLSGVLYVVGYIPSCVFWFLSMRSLGQRPGLYETFRAYYIGHLGKYVPGKAMVVVLRSGLLNHEKTRASIAAAAVFLETLTMMAAGAFLSAVIAIVWFRDTPQGNQLSLLALGMMLVSGLPIIPPVFRNIALRLGVGRSDPEIDAKLRGLTVKTLAIGWMLSTLTWIVLGFWLWASIRGLGIETGALAEHFPRFVMATALAVVAGFVLMIPGGVGVREFVLAQGLFAYFAGLPETAADATLWAMIVAAVQRVVSILAELFVSACLIVGRRKN